MAFASYVEYDASMDNHYWRSTVVNTWETVDLSTWSGSVVTHVPSGDVSGSLGIPANAVVEIICRNIRVGGGFQEVGVRSTSSSAARLIKLHKPEGGGHTNVSMFVQADADSRIECRSDLVNENSGPRFSVAGYWVGAEYVDLFSSFSFGPTSSWADRTLDTHGVPSGKIAEIAVINTSGGYAFQDGAPLTLGVRAVGSTLQRVVELHEPEVGLKSQTLNAREYMTMQVQSSGTNAVVQLWTSDSSISRANVLGYWSNPPGDYNECVIDLADATSDGVWQPRDVQSLGVTAGATVEFQLINENPSAQNVFGIQQSNGVFDRKLDIHEAEPTGNHTARMHAPLDNNGNVYIYHEDFVQPHRFLAVGYWDNYTGEIDTATASGNLFISGSQPAMNSITASGNLFVNSHNTISTSGNLYTYGLATYQISGNLFIEGHASHTAAIDLYIPGLDVFSTSGDLYMHGYAILVSSSDLFVGGKNSKTLSVDLFIEGHENSNTFEDMYIGGFNNISTSGDLFVQGKESIQVSGDLCIQGHEIAPTSGDLFVGGQDSAQTSGDLFLEGVETSSTFGDLFIKGRNSTTSSADLFINGKDVIQPSIDLYVIGKETIASSGDFFIHGVDTLIISGDLFIQGGVTVQISGDLYITALETIELSEDLFINGYKDTQVSGDLFIISHDVVQSSGDLFLSAPEQTTSSGDLFISGVDVSIIAFSDLYISGPESVTTSGDLFIRGVGPFRANAYYVEDFQNWVPIGVGVWETKDLSAYLPDNEDDITAEIVIANPNSAAGDYFVGVRTSGATLERKINLVPALDDGGYNTATMHVQVTNGEIECFAPSGVEFYLLGYWVGTRYVEAIDFFLASGVNSWLDRNLSDFGVPSGAIVETMAGQGFGGLLMGMRSVGSTDERRIRMVTGLSSTQRYTFWTSFLQTSGIGATIQHYVEDFENLQGFYLAGYWEFPPGDYTDVFQSDEANPTNDNVWESIDVSGVSSGDVASFGLFNSDSNDSRIFGIRESGSSLERKINIRSSKNTTYKIAHCWHTNINSPVEAISEEATSISDDFTLLGYWNNLNLITQTSGSIDLFIESMEILSSSGNLLIGGHETFQSSGDLFIQGQDILSLSSNLFIHGHLDHIVSGDLFIDGLDIINTSGDLFIYGSQPVIGFNASNDLFIRGFNTIQISSDLFIGGLQQIVISRDIFIQGHTDSTNSIDLFIEGFVDNFSSNSLTLAMHGQNIHQTSGDLLINGSEVVQTSGDLLLKGSDTINVSGDLFTISHRSIVSSNNLFIDGIQPIITSRDLFIHGQDSMNISGDLFVLPHISSNRQHNLFMIGYTQSSGLSNLFISSELSMNTSRDLYIYGLIDASGSANLFINSFGDIISISGSRDLFINGLEPKPALSCPILDPTASIQITDTLITVYQNNIDALINQLGKNVYLEFDPILSPCPNCTFDTIRKRSTGIYIPGGPRPFTRGRRCPYCKGKGLLETVVNKCIKCLIKWNPEDAKNFGISISQKKGVVRLKTFLTEADDLIRARLIIVNRDIVSQMKFKVKLIQGPIPVGLREDRYCISFWELL